MLFCKINIFFYIWTAFIVFSFFSDLLLLPLLICACIHIGHRHKQVKQMGIQFHSNSI